MLFMIYCYVIYVILSIRDYNMQTYLKHLWDETERLY